jgi:Flp pilus assembly protein CpaB
MSKSVRLGVALALVLTVAGVVGYVAARHDGEKPDRSDEAKAMAAKPSEAELAGAN